MEKYSLPKKFIAKFPVLPQDRAKLLVYNRETNKVTYSTFKNILDFIPKNSVLVFNETKVIPARVEVLKETGGKAEILYISHKRNTVCALSNRELKIGSRLFIKGKAMFTVLKREGRYYYLKCSAIEKLLNKFGKMPLPPYLKDSPLSESERKKEYQTVFAKNRGSIAAPTASLHFTKKLIRKIKKSIPIRFITLHVGLGTFLPVSKENIETGKLHGEEYSTDRETFSFLKKAKKQGKFIIAVGTTTARTLESGKRSGKTTLFIREGYKFKFVDGLITNFHIPNSSLLMLVAALIGREKMFDLYKKAMRKNFRFYSFGDGMMII